MTNASALTALQSLNAPTSSSKRRSRAFRPATASPGQRQRRLLVDRHHDASDNKALSAVQDALGLGASKVDTAYTAMTDIKDQVDQIKAKLVTARSASTGRQAEDRDRNQGHPGRRSSRRSPTPPLPARTCCRTIATGTPPTLEDRLFLQPHRHVPSPIDTIRRQALRHGRFSTANPRHPAASSAALLARRHCVRSEHHRRSLRRLPFDTRASGTDSDHQRCRRQTAPNRRRTISAPPRSRSTLRRASVEPDRTPSTAASASWSTPT